MSEHQQKKKRKAQRTSAKQKQAETPKKEKRELKAVLKELWMQEDNRFLLICAAGLVIIFLSPSLPGRTGLYVQSAIVGLIIFGCILRNVRRNGGEEEKEDETVKEENKIEENT